MRIRSLALALALAAGAVLVSAALLGETRPIRAGEEPRRVYVSGDAHHLLFWSAGEVPAATTYTVGTVDTRVGTGGHAPGEGEPLAGPPMLFRTDPKSGSMSAGRPEDLVTVGSVRWDERGQVLVSSGPDDALTLWWIEQGSVVRAKQLQSEIVPPFLESEERERDGGTEEDVHVSVPARTVVTSVVFEPAPPGRMAGAPRTR